MAGFILKNFVSIVASMTNHMKGTQSQVTDFNVGAVARTMVEAPAIEMDELYQNMFRGLQDAIPVSTYNTFNFPPLPSSAAFGLIGVNITSSAADTLIPAGSSITSVGGATSYTSQADVTILAGATTANILVAAAAAGSIGNIPADTVFTISPAPAGFVSASNATAFTNGADAETDDQRAQRFAAFIAALPRGTPAAILFGLTTTALFDVNGIQTEKVATAVVVEPYLLDNTQPVGLVNCFIHNGVGSTSTTLLNQAVQVIDGFIDSNGVPVPGWKSAGIHLTIAKATEVTQDLTAVLTAAPGYVKADLIPIAEAAWSNYVLGLAVAGGTGLSAYLDAEAKRIVKSIPGVANFVPSVPTADVTVTTGQKLMPGTLTIT